MFLYQTTRDRLERRNRELQRDLALGTAQIEQQEEELRRAREIQQALLPGKSRNYRGSKWREHGARRAR